MICWKCRYPITDESHFDGLTYTSEPPQYAHARCPVSRMRDDLDKLKAEVDRLQAAVADMRERAALTAMRGYVGAEIAASIRALPLE
jgi:hypothetical protein